MRTAEAYQQYTGAEIYQHPSHQRGYSPLVEGLTFSADTGEVREQIQYTPILVPISTLQPTATTDTTTATPTDTTTTSTDTAATSTDTTATPITAPVQPQPPPEPFTRDVVAGVAPIALPAYNLYPSLTNSTLMSAGMIPNRMFA